MMNPDKYAGSATKMPFIFYTPDGGPKISDARMWLNLTTNYLMFMKQPPGAQEDESGEASQSRTDDEEMSEEGIDWETTFE